MRQRFFWVLMVLMLIPARLAAAPAKLISYQGFLTNSANVPLNGQLDMTFRIYAVPSGGTALWVELHPGTLLDDGVFGVVLGELTPLTLPFDQQYWLGITVPASGGAELAPRSKVLASAYSIYALHAAVADTVLVAAVDSLLSPSKIQPQGSGSGLDADKVDGFHASTTALPNHLVVLDGNGKLPASGLPETQYAAGDIVLCAADTPRERISQTPYLIKEILIIRSGILRVKFDLWTRGSPGTVYGQIYRNGIPIGTEFSSVSDQPTTFVQDIGGWTRGDLVQLYVRTDYLSGWADVQNFRICGDQPEVSTATLN